MGKKNSHTLTQCYARTETEQETNKMKHCHVYNIREIVFMLCTTCRSFGEF